MKNRPALLLTNDDGIFASGLHSLYEGVKNEVETMLVAPHAQQSGASLATTLNRPLHIEKIHLMGKEVFTVNGTPADCVKMALSVILDKKPDLILSGINKGINSGRSALFSGTVGGVIEGVFRNIPGIAFSAEDSSDLSFERFEKYIFPIVSYFLSHPLPEGTFLNVTFPGKEVVGIKMATQGMSHWMEDLQRRVTPFGNTYYWLGSRWLTYEEKLSSDVSLLQEGYITIVPLRVEDLTDHAVLKSHGADMEDVLKKHFDSRKISLK